MGHPWQYKIEDIGNTQEGEKLDINISDIETSARVLRNTWVYTGCVIFSRQDVTLVFLDDEAVSVSDMFNKQASSFRHIPSFFF